MLPTTQFTYWKGLGTCDELLCVSHTLQIALESGQEARIVLIDFSAAFDRVNHLGILYIIIIIIIKRGWQCKAGRERLTPYQSEDNNPTTPTHRKKEEKGKTVGDKKGASS